jgi:predicted RNase H-like nuclease (RuvC/YqgF family)
MAEGLAEKIERLLAAAERAHTDRAACRREVETLTGENRELRRLIGHAHARIETLAGQLRQLERNADKADEE